MLISVVGAQTPQPESMALAEDVGREIARRGHTVVCGGLTGVMEAVCRGARAAGGHTIGILPGVDPQDANPYVEVAIPTGLGVARNAIVARSGAAVIALDGAYGTLSEIAFAFQFGTPVVGLETWPLQDRDGSDPVVRATDAADAVDLALRLAAAGRSAVTPPERGNRGPERVQEEQAP